MQAGIVLHAFFALLAFFAQSIKSLFYPRSKPLLQDTVYVFADQEQYQRIAAVLQQKGCNPVQLKSLHNTAGFKKGQQLVLCLSRKPMAYYIAWLQQQRLPVQCFFHIPGSGSMVGSSMASRNGHALVMPAGAPLTAAHTGVVN
jgi:hypothetical protein